MMEAFNYLAVLLSLILGLAITQVLQGYRGLLLARGRVRLAAAPLIWSAVVLVGAVQAWWASFGLRDQQQWSFGVFAIILLQMTMQYMAAAVVLPDTMGSDRPIDLADHHDRHRRAFFGFFIATLVISLGKDWVIDGRLPEAANLASQLLAVVIAVTGMLVGSARVQLVLAVLAAIGLAFYIGQLFERL